MAENNVALRVKFPGLYLPEAGKFFFSDRRHDSETVLSILHYQLLNRMQHRGGRTFWHSNRHIETCFELQKSGYTGFIFSTGDITVSISPCPKVLRVSTSGGLQEMGVSIKNFPLVS